MADGTKRQSSTAPSSSVQRWLVLYLKGFCMGAADMVPGISGGTIALVAGIYERLITAVAALDPRVLLQLPNVRTSAGRRQLAGTLVRMDVPFLLVLGAGIATAVLALSRVIHVVFESYPAVVSAFFFSLMAASAVVMYRGIRVETTGQLAAGPVGIVVAFGLAGTTGGGDGGSLPAVFLAGAIAISAMVLPGISGAAFLYILGQYQYLLGSLNDFIAAVAELPLGGGAAGVLDAGLVVAVFLTGAVVGLLTTARAVKWALARYRVALLAFLVGLMVGALRLPVEHAVTETAKWTPTLVATTVFAGGLGAGVVLLLDRRTESLDYA